METTSYGALYCSLNRRITRLVFVVQDTDKYIGIHIDNHISIQYTIWLYIIIPSLSRKRASTNVETIPNSKKRGDGNPFVKMSTN
jgi:hypothetical protein